MRLASIPLLAVKYFFTFSARAMASFYDAGQQPYFVTLNADLSGAPQCALVWIAGGEMRSIAAPENLARGRCSDVDAWVPIVKRTLRKA